MQGREVDRFLFGGYALEEDTRGQYTHSLEAEQYMNKHCIGLLNTEPNVNILSKYSESSQIWKAEKNIE